MMQRIAEAPPQFKARTAGVFWLMVFLAGSLALFLGGRVIFSAYNLVPGMIGEGLLILWLLVKGVNVQRWKDLASAAGEYPSQRAMQP